MTIYDTLLDVLKKFPYLKTPTRIIQFKYADYVKWELRLQKLQDDLYKYTFEHLDDDTHTILRRDINDRTITIITNDDNLCTQPFVIHYDCQSIKSLSGKQIDSLWTIATEEVDKWNENRLKNAVQNVLRNIMANPSYDSINFYKAIIGIINEFRSNMETE